MAWRAANEGPHHGWSRVPGHRVGRGRSCGRCSVGTDDLRQPLPAEPQPVSWAQRAGQAHSVCPGRHPQSGRFETTIGTNQTFSNINVFKIKSVAEGEEILSSISDVLIELLGESNYNQYFGSGGDLSGFSLAGNSIILNNESVPIGQLNEIVSQLNQGNISIITIEVE